MAQSRKITYGPLILALLSWGIAGGEIYKRAAIELNGTIASPETHCLQPANIRCGTHYIVEGRDGSRDICVGPDGRVPAHRSPGWNRDREGEVGALVLDQRTPYR
jgi:hypothetical protein